MTTATETAAPPETEAEVVEAPTPEALLPRLALEGLSLSAAGEALGPIDLALGAGERLAVLGEPGSGQAALLAALAGETRAAAGRILLDGARLDRLRGRARRQARARISILWRNPHGAFDPALRVLDSLAAPLAALRPGGRRMPLIERRKRLLSALGAAGGEAAWAEAVPSALAPAALQRMALARALAPMPDLVVLDEPLACLDAAERSAFADRLAGIASAEGPAILLLTAEPGLAARLASRVAVLHLGRVVEEGPAHELLTAPRHPYAKRLVERQTAPVARAETVAGPGPRTGCRFAPACPLAVDRCRSEVPKLLASGAASVACHAVEEGREATA